MKNILVIEDEQNVAAFIKKGLEEEGYNVFLAYDGTTGLELLKQRKIDAAVLDIILPGINGLEIVKEIRRRGFADVPVVMLTALGTTENIVTGLDAGADDYLIKPFKFKELLARLRALSRRKNLSVETDQLLSISDLELDVNAKTVKRNGKEIKLTSTEYRLLEYFLNNQGRVLSRIDILESVWDIGFNMGTNVVDVYVNYLRNKIEKGYKSKLIHTVIGMGYIMKEDYEGS
ncbi:DNA-binding response regulator, OmpR family, contains REC and winged-helix (wHTH) domain [Zhouia amylolytica]|uniref:DNA-binding response regulator, OmpR family, contains REC and winged-helix (WHTH) domain n=1 Tax=Zhouia amylolytica TaxID=376730 RepID=A0A1I6TTQ9_9FLAO|nr:response regulator transcription factor [Zhouia amylolytica]SFS92458.1 DNA-binding response regulator, OmpR family, contains REC and winged-helix (wHTH) domain [Zhouia amylolytica]